MARSIDRSSTDLRISTSDEMVQRKQKDDDGDGGRERKEGRSTGHEQSPRSESACSRRILVIIARREA